MSGFFKKAKNKAKGVAENLRPPSRQRRSTQSTLNLGASLATILPIHDSSTAEPAFSSSKSPTPAAPVYVLPSAPPSALSTTGSVIYELLTAIRDGSDMCLPLKAAVVGVLKIWDVCERTVQLQQEFVNHKEKLERLLNITTTYQDESDLSDNLRGRLEEIAIALQHFTRAVQAKLDRGLTSRVLQSNNDIGEVKDLITKVMSLIDVFEFEGGVRVEIGVQQVKSGVEEIQHGVDQVEDGIVQLQDGVKKAQDGVNQVKDGVDQVRDGVEEVKYGVEEVTRVVDDINRRMTAAEQLQAAREHEQHLERLRSFISTALDKQHVREAVYDAQQRSGCMEGTRIDVLDRVFRWIMDPKAQPIFWLGGMAGTGKTSIAWSICERVKADDALCLGGSFFCSRSTGSAAQRDVRCVIPTLAQLLARQSEAFAIALAAELKEEPDLAYKQVKVQVEQLLSKPLAALSSSTKSIVFIVDALDECGDQPTATAPGDNSEAHASVSEMLEALIDFSRSSANLPVKFIVTSRPETHIRETSITDIKVTSALHLHTIDKSQVTNDIQLYISKTLSKAPATQTWFINEHVESLAERADGLFIFAATAIKYILGGGQGHRAKRLISLVSPLQAAPTALAVAPLDVMYSLILMEASHSDMVEVDELEQMRKVVAAILSARMSLSVEALAELLDLSTHYLRGCLDRLHAVVHLPEDNHDASLRTLHASFGDYLFTRAAHGIRIPSSLGHDELAQGCLRRMKRDDLGFNISRCPSSYQPNPKIEPDCIPPSLRYACMHWSYHIQSASVQLVFEEDISAVFRPKFLFWLEVLSALGEVRRASGLLRIASFSIKAVELTQFLRDANSFVASSREAIEWSAPHIYLSALPFAPKGSLVFRDFASLLTGVVSVETFGIDRHGDRLIMNLTGHQAPVFSVAYSPDGRLLASGSEDGEVRLWDALTGEETMPPLQNGDNVVRCIAFTTDGQRVVSCTDSNDGVIHIWDVRTGRAAMSPLRGHSGMVLSVAVSQDGRLIASASEDKSVRLWNAATDEVIAVLTGHEGEVLCVAFSSNGHTLASGSTDTIRLWNTHTHELHGQPLRGQRSHVWSVAFSPDGKLIAAGYDDQLIRIWNVSTRVEIVSPLEAECKIYGLFFAPDGSRLAYLDLYDTFFWDWKTNQDIAPALGRHMGFVRAISHSSDGHYIATASDDRTVRIWDAEHPQSMTDRLSSHEGDVNSVAVSADGSFIVSGSADQTIRVWDSQKAEPILPPLMDHRDEVLSVAVSADGQLIASGSADCTVRLWNAKTGEPIGEPLGHTGTILAVTFSRDVRWLASASNDNTVGLWDIASDQHPTNLRRLRCENRPRSVAISPNGRRLAVGESGGQLIIWDMSGGDLAQFSVLDVGDFYGAPSVCFSPDDSQIAAASHDRNAYVWDLQTRVLLSTLRGHDSYVRAVAYSPDGQYIASGSGDYTIRLWDVITGQAVTVLRGHASSVRSVAFFPDGKSLVSGADDQTIRSWDLVNAIAQSSQANLSPIYTLAKANQENGWLVSASKERLVWIPQEYRANLVIGRDRATLIASHHVVLSADTVLHQGEEWVKCWRGAKLTATASSS